MFNENAMTGEIFFGRMKYWNANRKIADNNDNYNNRDNSYFFDEQLSTQCHVNYKKNKQIWSMFSIYYIYLEDATEN